MPSALPIAAFIGIAEPYVVGFALCALIPGFQINGFVISLFFNPSGCFDYSEKWEGRDLAAFLFVVINAGC
ncbi:MAG TPA: hypothetical protein VF596_18505 [Pyrinomonadaceae bacterium]|jgi:hypothetical protein